MSGRGKLRGAAAAGLAVLALLIWGLPFPAYETATLLPVETVQLARTEDGRVLLRTEAGDGVGADWASAVRDLRANAPGTVLLDTAEQLVLCTDESELLQEAAGSGDLRPAVQLRHADALRGTDGLAELLHAHESDWTLAEVMARQKPRSEIRPSAGCGFAAKFAPWASEILKYADACEMRACARVKMKTED